MTIVCLDMEGVWATGNWIAVSGKVGVGDFKSTICEELYILNC